jgi:hypothetical protein
MASLVLRSLYLIVIFIVLIFYGLIYGLLLIFTIFLWLLAFSFGVPINSTKHQSFKLLNGSGTSFNNNKIWKIRCHSLVCNQAESTHMILLSIHVNFEFQMWLIQGIHFENSYSTFIIHDVTLMFAAHFCFSLLSCQLIIFVSFKVSF